MNKHCCQEMEKSVTLDCDQHPDIYSCPDVLVRYIPKFDEYGIIIHDGGSAASEIKFCPWCGNTLPESKRDAWFDALEELGFDDPSEQNIPAEFNSDAWHRNT
ncbi:hypothetical protein [Alteromonas sp. C1M14]|uniref:DUF6980 family protein n=1 Tax=Alteromonas sp. C1M14 TaxID=2841567 RepID=UPI001C0946D8|nr:hypothetical protein [Alteromonas sp. C1M14]MBU2978787.1 hypothetical protein [Alteromonas sp. C1M14]